MISLHVNPALSPLEKNQLHATAYYLDDIQEEMMLSGEKIEHAYRFIYGVP